MEPLLRDIHTPSPISWWPLAPGWYGLVILIFVFFGLCFWLYRAIRNKYSLQRLALVKLKHIQHLYLQQHNNAATITALNQLLRQVGFVYCPRENVAALLGKNWLLFLDARMGSEEFTQGVGQLLSTEAYKPQSDVDLQPLFQLVEKWLKCTTTKKKRWREVEHV